jgi:PAS domain S-box-containing protein
MNGCPNIKLNTYFYGYHSTNLTSRMNQALEPFFNQSIDCLCIADYAGYFVEINPAFQQLLGYSEEELKSRPISEFIFDEDREETATNRKKLLNNVPLVHFENRYVCKSGELVWLHWTSIPLPEKSLVYAIAKDVTYTKKLQQERKTHMTQLSKTNKQLRQLTYSTSHDLRSPLNNLMALVNIIDMNKIDNAETKEILGLIKLSATGLNDTLNNYLDTFKSNDVGMTISQSLHIGEVLKQVQRSISRLIAHSGASFNVDFSTFDTISFNKTCLESLFLNLITNSIKYAKPEIPPQISIKTAVKNGKKTLSFTDNGRGIDMEKVGHLIFKLNERFHNEKDSKGVGLYLVHQMITDHGASIEVDSEVDRGTTFTITFKSS